MTRRFPTRQQYRTGVIVLATGVNVGIAIRFWAATFIVPPPLTIDWTRPIYWALGIVSAASALQITRSSRGILAVAMWRLLLLLNALPFAGYFGVAFFLFNRAFSRITP